MTYTVLARRYRSQSFDELVGQDAVARTLRAALEQSRVAHAYLFVGPRGVGKTSTARLLAKALNGGAEDVDRAIMTGQDADVVEIDAASHGNVEEARELIAGSVYRPLRGPYKIYIIDEVHMLSSAAFNALLKTMEEPPEHVKFILCTTEAHKVPATIQSRCQRFDFRLITAARIAEHLTRVLQTEGVQAEPEVPAAVARLGAGSMRDALTILDRVVAAAPKDAPLTADLLDELLGLPDRRLVADHIEAFADADARRALEVADQLLARGVSPDQLLETLARSLRDLMVLSACGPDTDLVDLAGDSRAAALALAARFDLPALVHMIALTEHAHRAIRSSAAPRALLDALVVRLALSDSLLDVATLLRDGGAAAPRKPPPKKA